jgi:hypothetical protein
MNPADGPNPENVVTKSGHSVREAIKKGIGGLKTGFGVAKDAGSRRAKKNKDDRQSVHPTTIAAINSSRKTTEFQKQERKVLSL